MFSQLKYFALPWYEALLNFRQLYRWIPHVWNPAYAYPSARIEQIQLGALRTTAKKMKCSRESYQSPSYTFTYT